VHDVITELRNDPGYWDCNELPQPVGANRPRMTLERLDRRICASMLRGVCVQYVDVRRDVADIDIYSGIPRSQFYSAAISCCQWYSPTYNSRW
jgi:hypothetical protein